MRELDAEGGERLHRYDAFGDKRETVDALRNLRLFTYDKMSRLWKRH